MQLLAELVREIIAKLVKWFKSSKKALEKKFSEQTTTDLAFDQVVFSNSSPNMPA